MEVPAEQGQPELDKLAEMLVSVKEKGDGFSRETMKLIEQLQNDLAKSLRAPANAVRRKEPLAFSPNFTKLSEEFLMEQGHGDGYRRALQGLQHWCTEKNLTLASLKYQDAQSYVESLKKKYRQSTLVLNVRGVRAFFLWLIKKGILTRNPIPFLAEPERSNEERESSLLSQEDIQTLFDSFEQKSARDLRDRAVIGVILYTFTPISSIPKLQTGDYTIERNKAFMRIHLPSADYRVPLHPEAKKYIEEHLQNEKFVGAQDSPLFPPEEKYRASQSPLHNISKSRVEDMIRKRGKRIGLVQNLTSSRIRQTGVAALLKNFKSFEEVADAGFASGRTTFKRYKAIAHLAPTLFDDDIDIASPLMNFIEKSGIFRIPEDS